jgi:hypothetical protein
MRWHRISSSCYLWDLGKESSDSIRQGRDSAAINFSRQPLCHGHGSECCTGCFTKSFTMVSQMLICGECFEKVYASRLTNYASFNSLKSRNVVNIFVTLVHSDIWNTMVKIF